MNKFIKSLVLFSLCVLILSSCSEKKAKYVFFFIGDGMGFTHVSMAEAYLANQHKVLGNDPLCFTQFPVLGMVTTYSASNIITCSSAAGTALSTGTKTNNGFLCVAPDSTDLTSISYKIHNAGIPVGIMTTVTLSHATPAAFYANSISRNDYYKIALKLPESGFEFFGGGGFEEPTGNNEGDPSLYNVISEKGYTVACGLKDFNTKKNSAKKIILLQEDSIKNNVLPYAIDRKESDLTLKQVVSAAIEVLENEKGFFIMAEGGKIDWAAHANDALSDILETLDMDAAIEVAYQFYLKHKDETLIIVTADHETGGFSMGKDKGYVMYFDELKAQTSSLDSKKILKDTVTAINNRARIGWTTSSHTGTAVPIFAIGTQSEQFAGRMDNTDIPKKICNAMGITF